MLTHHLEKCNRFISLDPIERSVFASHYDRIRDAIIDQMKKRDELFNKIYHRPQLSGSYADQLKVSRPNEYDLLMIFKLPYLNVEKIASKPGYVQIKTIQQKGWYGIGRILDRDGYLMQNKVLEWLRIIMKSIFPHNYNLLKIGPHEYMVTHSVNGPANTLDIQCGRQYNENTRFSIDFVGALEFPVAEVWTADTQSHRFRDSYWNAIPEPRKSTPTQNSSQQQAPRRTNSANINTYTLHNIQRRNLNKNRAWICSYAAIERDLIHGFQFIKPLIRIFKKIRDTQSLTNFKSYYIKQIFILKRMQQAANYWEQSLGELFLAMLDVIIEHLDRMKLPFYWHKQFDLWHNFNRQQIENMGNKFKRIKRDIDSHGPDYIYKVILTAVEQQRINQFI